MDIDQVHAPQRLQGETLPEYAARRRMSARRQERVKLLFTPGRVPKLPADHADSQRKALVAAVGVRQAKKAMRAARAGSASNA